MRVVQILEGIGLYICCVASFHLAMSGPLSDAFFFRHEILDDTFELFWNFNETHIMFKVAAKTNGLILFGLSSKVKMDHFDIIIGGVNNGNSYFKDMHLNQHDRLIVDFRQDWHLVNASESDNKTTLIFIRLLDTRDSEDVPITNDIISVKFNLEFKDYDNEKHINYTRFHTKNVTYVNFTESEFAMVDNVKMFELLMDNFHVPEKEMYVQCRIFTLSELQEKHHLIRYEPVIEVGHEHIVHHILLYTCEKPIHKRLTKSSFNCREDSPIEILKCKSTFILWTMDGPAYEYPPNVGFPLGGPRGSNVLIMETHYKSDGRKVYVDKSGLRIFLTKQLRHYDAGLLGVAVEMTHSLIIPPFEENFKTSGYCHEYCINKALEDQKIRVFLVFLHTHSLGKNIRALHVRNGTHISPLFVDDNYNPSHQVLFEFKEEFIIKKGDALMVQCEYNSSEKTSVTFGGEEMCSFHIFYYPQVYIHHCSSSLKYRNDSLSSVVEIFNWTDPSVKGKFAKEVEDAEVSYTCILSDGETNFIGPVPQYTYP